MVRRNGAIDPHPSARDLRTGHRNRLKPPFNLRQRGASTFSQIGCPQEATRGAPARGLPLGAAADTEHEPTADPALPPIPDDEFNQRIAW